MLWRMNMKRILLVTLIILLTACSSGEKEYKMGLQYLKEGKADLAKEYFLKAVEKNPDRASCYINIAKLYLEKGWLEGAITNCLKAIDVLETKRRTVTGIPYEIVLSEAYNTLGEIEVQKTKQAEMSVDLDTFQIQNFSTALNHFAKALQLDPKNAKAEANFKKYQKVM
jgi:tetratricopeptide (TPR) repeat protein